MTGQQVKSWLTVSWGGGPGQRETGQSSDPRKCDFSTSFSPPGPHLDNKGTIRGYKGKKKKGKAAAPPKKLRSAGVVAVAMGREEIGWKQKTVSGRQVKRQ